MNIWRLVLKEIQRRKLNFGLGLLSITIAVAVLVGALTMLKAHDIRTQRIIAHREAQTKARMKALEDDYRKIMKGMGFNLLILPKDQNLSDLYADDYASKYMPEEYVHKLSSSESCPSATCCQVCSKRSDGMRKKEPSFSSALVERFHCSIGSQKNRFLLLCRTGT